MHAPLATLERIFRRFLPSPTFSIVRPTSRYLVRVRLSFPHPSSLLTEYIYVRAATVESCFEPPAGQDPYTYVFDLTGEIQWDRPEKVRAARALALIFPKKKKLNADSRFAHLYGMIAYSCRFRSTTRSALRDRLGVRRLGGKSMPMCGSSTHFMNVKIKGPMMRKRISNLRVFTALGGTRRFECSVTSQSKSTVSLEPLVHVSDLRVVLTCFLSVRFYQSQFGHSTYSVRIRALCQLRTCVHCLPCRTF